MTKQAERVVAWLGAVAMAGAGALLATAAGAADMAAIRKAPQEPAPAQATGYVELYTGWARDTLDFTFCNPSCLNFTDRFAGWALGGAGRATYWWVPNASIQLDAQGEGTSNRYSSRVSSDRYSTHSYLVGGHANWRDPQRGLLGIFGGVGDTSAYSLQPIIRHWLVGLEGQAYWGPVTLYGQVGYDSTVGPIIGSALDGLHAWFVRGTARLYVNPNFRLEGTVYYASGEFDWTAIAFIRSTEFNTWLWRAKAEHKFGTLPFSIFAVYEGSRMTQDVVATSYTETARVTDHRILGGIRLYLGENTLQWNDNRGTSLDIIAPLSVSSFNFKVPVE